MRVGRDVSILTLRDDTVQLFVAPISVSTMQPISKRRYSTLQNHHDTLSNEL